MERFKLHIEAESRIRWKVYVRFGGEFSETDYSNMARRRLLSLHFQVPRPFDHCLQPPAEPLGRVRGKAEILCNQFRRSASFAPLQPHTSRLYGGHYGRLRERVHNPIKFEQDVGTKAGRLLRRIAHNPLCSNHLVSQVRP